MPCSSRMAASPPRVSAPRLVLAGGGHAHIEVLRQLARRPALRACFSSVTLLSPDTRLDYTGLVPAVIAGHANRHSLSISLAALTQAAGAEPVWASLVGLDAERQRLTLSDGDALVYDRLSLDIGARPAPVPGAGLPHVVPVKPVAALWLGLTGAERRLQRAGQPRVAVVGGGAGGVELALALAYRWRHWRRRPMITLLDRGRELLADQSAAVRRKLARALRDAGVAVATGRALVRIETDTIVTGDGGQLPADAVFMATGAVPAADFSASGLALDDRGFVRVGWDLRSVSHPHVFAAGDIAALPRPRPKAGVWAVRAGPVLCGNLERSLGEAPLRALAANRGALALISEGRRSAVAARGWPFAPAGYAVWCLKQAIDRRFVGRYRDVRNDGASPV